ESVLPTCARGPQAMKMGVQPLMTTCRIAASRSLPRLCSASLAGRRCQDVGELHPVELRVDGTQPGADIAAQHEGIAGLLAVTRPVGDKGRKARPRQLNLFVGHLVELGDDDLAGASDLTEIGLCCRRAPVEEGR